MVSCGVLIVGIKVGLRVAGFARTLQWIHWRTDHLPRWRTGPPPAIDPVAHAVALAAALYPGRARCLEQSLLLYYLLRRRGIEAHFRLGVQPHPLGPRVGLEWGHADQQCPGARAALRPDPGAAGMNCFLFLADTDGRIRSRIAPDGNTSTRAAVRSWM